MKSPKTQPCAQCPFKRQSLPGYLGADDPESFITKTMADMEMPCHMSVDYEDPDWESTLDDAQQCAGAAIMFSNMCKLSRDPRRKRLPADRETVFARPEEFLAHHTLKNHKR